MYFLINNAHRTGIIENLLIAGNSPQKIAKDADIPLSRVKAIERKIKKC